MEPGRTVQVCSPLRAPSECRWECDERLAPRPCAPRRQAGPGSGFTLIELLFVLSVLVIAFLAFSQSLVSSMRLTRVNRESALATDGARRVIEVLEGVEEFSTIYRLYNGDPGDDPVPGTGPGSAFAVEGLRAAADDPDGMVGEIAFPDVDTGAALELREDIDLPELGLPRDLTGDGLVDALDHADDYLLLPVLVRLRWVGISGERTLEVRTLIADR